MSHISEYEVENMFIDRLESIGYKFIKLDDYDAVLANLRTQLALFNAKKLAEKGHAASFSDAEFNRIMIHIDNHSVYESAKILRDKFVLTLDDGETVYIDFFSSDTDRNIYQVTHQVTMDKSHKDDVVYTNRYDVTVLINGLPLVQIELKRPGVEINEAINQINRYRKFSFKGIFRYLQLFVVSNSVQTKYFCNENEMMDGQYNPILKSLVFFWTDEKNTRINDLNSFTGEFFRKSALTEMIDKYMVIKTTEPILMVMRPYQIYAVKAAKKRVLEANQDGYVFACTGSGKTLTSFKLAQLLRDESSVDLVVFLIDRKDLDDQTVDEYNSFEKDCVDNTDSTYVLINMLKSSEKKMIVTTIQKMANAVKNPKYASVMDAYKDKKVVFIIDECHRSQFGKMHGQIQKHFERANYIGFTGTPIFEKNKGADGRTTADVFHAGGKLDSCLHKYMIKDAIADGNVLRFSVEYQRTIFARNLAVKGIDPEQLDDPDYCKRHKIDMEPLYHDDERIAGIAKHIMEHHEQHVHPQGKDIYTALFAVDKIQTLGKYYDEFKKLNDAVPEDKKLKIAAVFSYQTNEEISYNQKGKVLDLILPVIVLIMSCIIGMIYTGGFFDGKDLITAFSQCDASRGLVYGTFVTLVFVFILYIPRKIISYNEFVECIPEGFKAMVPSILILVLAWSLGDLVSNQLQAGAFVYNTLQSASISTAILPACLFIVGAGLSFSTGTSWGTFGILIPMATSLFPEGSTMLVISIASILLFVFSFRVFSGSACSCASCFGGVGGDVCCLPPVCGHTCCHLSL